MIYVDIPFKVTKEDFPNAPRCFVNKDSAHLFADSTEELVEYAISIGMKANWIQRKGTPFEHFDVTGVKLQKVLNDNKVEKVDSMLEIARKKRKLL